MTEYFGNGQFHHRSMKQGVHQTGVNKDNLIQIDIHDKHNNVHTTRLTIVTLNVRSLKSKDQIVLDAMIKYQIDVLVLTETWLKENDDDQAWVAGSGLNKEPYLMLSVPRPNGSGGGIAIICKSSLEPRTIHQGCHLSFEHATGTLSNKKKPFMSREYTIHH